MKEDLQLLAQVGAHQTLHMDEQVMGAGGRGRLLLTVAVLHLHGRERSRFNDFRPFVYGQEYAQSTR